MRSKFWLCGMAVLGLCLVGTRQANGSCCKARLGDVVAEFSLARPSLTALSSDAVSELIFGHEKTVERLLVDREAHTYFGYTLAAETVAGTRTIRVTLAPLSGNGEEQLRALTDHPDAWQLLCPGCPAPSELKAIAPKPSQFPPAQAVSDGDSFLFEALVNPKTGQKLVDVIRVSVTEDPPMEEAVLSMKDARLTVNGQTLSNTATCRGQVIAFFLKGRGRYVISIKKRDGFETTAMLKTDRIEFSLGSDRFEWQSSEPIIRPPSWGAPPSGKKMTLLMPLWVKHEPNWKDPNATAVVPQGGYSASAWSGPGHD